MFDEISERLYYLVIQKRQYSFYINNLKLYQIPASLSPILQPSNQFNVQFSSNLNIPTLNQQLSVKPEDITASGALNLQQSVVLGNSQVANPDTICDMRYYNELMSSLPAEYVSTPIILHCMIEQVRSIEMSSVVPSNKINHEGEHFHSR